MTGDSLIAARSICALMLSSLAAGVSVCAQSAVPATDVSGVWWTESYHAKLVPVGGDAIPLTAEGRAAFAKNASALQADPAADQARAACLPQGIPRSLLEPYPFRVYQSATQVTFIHEANRTFRIVRIAGSHADPDVWDPSFMGEGIGRWENGVLTIDTTNFNGRTWLDDSGLPHSDQLHTVERLRTINNGLELEDVITIEDPVMFTRPWSVRLVFRLRPDVTLTTDHVCGEPRRDISKVAGGESYR